MTYTKKQNLLRNNFKRLTPMKRLSVHASVISSNDKFYRKKIVSIKKIYGVRFHNDILTKSLNTKIMWYNVNYLTINE